MSKHKGNGFTHEQEFVTRVTDELRKYKPHEIAAILCAVISAYAEEHNSHPASIGNSIAWMLNKAYAKEGEENVSEEISDNFRKRYPPTENP